MIAVAAQIGVMPLNCVGGTARRRFRRGGHGCRRGDRGNCVLTSSR